MEDRKWNDEYERALNSLQSIAVLLAFVVLFCIVVEIGKRFINLCNDPQSLETPLLVRVELVEPFSQRPHESSPL